MLVSVISLSKDVRRFENVDWQKYGRVYRFS